MSLEYNRKMIPRAKDLRREMTREERKLWYGFLREYPVHFQRQKTIGSYIVDFFCHQALLVVELDGSQHYDQHGIGYDRARTEFLESAGIQVIRIPNASIRYDFEGVCSMIDAEVKRRADAAAETLPKIQWRRE